MLARGLIISRRFVKVGTSPKHRSTHISNYQISEHESNQHDESDMVKFLCTLKNALLIIRDHFDLSFASKDWAILLHFCYYYRHLLITNYLAIKLLVSYNVSACREYLAENHFSFPSAPRWVQHSFLSKGLRLIPYTCGSSPIEVMHLGFKHITHHRTHTYFWAT